MCVYGHQRVLFAGTEEVHAPSLLCLSPSTMVSWLTASSLSHQAWLFSFPFGPQGSLLGPFLKCPPPRVPNIRTGAPTGVLVVRSPGHKTHQQPLIWC